MAWESDENQIEEPRDRTWMLWTGIVLVVAVMIGVMFVNRPTKTVESRARVSHLLIKFDPSNPADRDAAYQEITDLRKRALDGEDFAELAQNYSDDSLSARRGGSMGWVEREFLTPTVDEYVWIGAVGEVSEPIESPFGYHLVLIEDRELSYTESYERRLHDRVLEGAGTSGDGSEPPAGATE